MGWLKAVRAVLLGCILVGMTATASAAVETETDQTAQKTAAPRPALPAWAVTCSNQNAAGKLRCKMEQSLFVAKTRQRIVGVAFEGSGDKKQFLNAKVHLPHGIKLKSGLHLWVDEGEKRGVDISYADSDGSYALFPIDESFIGELKKGKVLRLQVEAMSGKNTIFELKLDGVSDALKYVEDFR